MNVALSDTGALASSGKERPYWDDGAHFQQWYPLCLTSTVLPGKIVGKDWLNTRVIVYRDPLGKVVVQSAFCPHLGADLSAGEIVEGQVRCAYHHWQFNSTGQCSRVPTMTTPPRAARVFNYPAVEKWGIVWMFNGETALYDPPSFAGVEEDELLYTTYERDKPFFADAWIVASNAFDFQHLLTIHKMPATTLPTNVKFDEFVATYDFTLWQPNGKARQQGCNTFAIGSGLPMAYENFLMFTNNVPAPGVSNPFHVAAVRKEAGVDEIELKERLAAVDAVARDFYGQDEPVLNSMRFRRRGDAKLVKEDRYLAEYLGWVERYPRAKPLDT